MPENRCHPPEGLLPARACSLSELQNALLQKTILTAMVQRCDAALDLHLDLGGLHAQIPRDEVTAPWISGADRAIAILSRVGRPACFTVTSLTADAKGAPVALLSRRQAQEQAMESFSTTLRPGSVVTGQVVHLAPFGAFVDIGRGIVALLPTAYISTARLHHPGEVFRTGQNILAVVKSFDRETRRITLTHKELLGTWMENASRFAVGDAVRGVVRGVKEYGCFVSLTPNLSGLTDRRDDLHEGDAVSVLIRSLCPEKMKIKLQVLEPLPPRSEPEPLTYWITDGVLNRWNYAPPNSEKGPVFTDFTADP